MRKTVYIRNPYLMALMIVIIAVIFIKEKILKVSMISEMHKKI